MRKLLCIYFIFLALPLTGSQLPTGFVEKLIAQNLDPTDMVIAPDGRIFITIKSGKILIVENGVLSTSLLLTLSVDNFNERGLGHIVLDPNFNSNNYYYVYYTVPNSNFNRVSRFTANGNSTLPGSELVLLDLDVLSGTIHNAGDMAFGLDGKLYITSGDGANPTSSQSFSSLLGKVLRINSDGSIPTDNPYYATSSGKYRAVWALGFRNPFSTDIQPGTGTVLVSDVGQETWEEINEVQAGKNYGWPIIEGPKTNQIPPANYKDPLFAYQHGTGIDRGCAIVGASFYNPAINDFPAEYVGKFFFADYCNGYIKYIDATNGTLKVFATGISRPVAILTAPDGSLYYLARAGQGGGSQEDNTSSSNGTLWKVNYTGSGAPSISSQPQNTFAAIGDVVRFNTGASGTQPLTYQWYIDGVAQPSSNSNIFSFAVTQLSDNGKKFSCQVANSFGSITTSEVVLTVTANSRPVPQITITLPGGATLYQAGQTLQFSGSATDAEDAIIPTTSFTWKIDFHHDQHTHPGLAPTSGLGAGTYVIPKVGETADNVWYRVILTAADNEGLTGTTYTDVFPQKTTITLATTPPSLQLILDGQPLQTPASITSVVGIKRTLEAPLTQLSGANLYVFKNWTENGLARLVSFDVPNSVKNFTAQYEAVPVGNGDGLLGNYRNAKNPQGDGFSSPVIILRIDPQINFDWGGGSPGAGIGNDNFTVRWEGEVLPQFTERYTFYTTIDDGVRLWIDDVLLIDKWIPQASTEWSNFIDLMGQKKYRIKFEYFELGGGAVAKLAWSSLSIPKQIIPQSQLFATILTATESNTLAKEDAYIFPQPASQEINFSKLPGHVGDRYQIIDLTGRLVLEGKLEHGSIDIRTLSNGLFLFKTNSFAGKFIKK
jgi:glucose/arabinose dehydrogenase